MARKKTHISKLTAATVVPSYPHAAAVTATAAAAVVMLLIRNVYDHLFFKNAIFVSRFKRKKEPCL